MYRELILTLFLGFLFSLLLHGENPMPMVFDTSEEIIEQQLDSVAILIASDDYTTAITYFDQISVPTTKALANEYYYLLGKILTHQGAYREAVAKLRKSLSFIQSKKDTTYADICNTLGNCYLRLSDFEQASEQYYKVLDIRKRILGPNHIKVGYVYNNLGLIEETKANLEEALTFYNESLSIAEHNYGKDHPETADAYIKIGGLHQIKRNFSEANDYIQKALQIHMEASGPDHMSTASAYYTLGVLNAEIGNHVKSIAFMSKAAAIFKTTLGDAHPAVFYFKYLIALGHITRGQYEEAEVLLNEVVQFQKEIKEEKGIQMALAYEHLGKVHLANNNEAVAIDYYDRSLEIYEAINGVNHPDTYTAYLSKGKALCQQEENLQEGLVALKKAVQIGQEIYSDAPNKLFSVYLELGKCYLDLGDYKKADVFLHLTHELLSDSDKSNYSSYNLLETEIELVHLGLEKFQAYKKIDDLYQVSDQLVSIEKRLDYLKKLFQSIDSGQSLTDQFFDFYQYAIEINYHLYTETGKQEYAEKVFAYSEKSKTFILMRTLQNEEALQVAGIPDSMVAKANNLSADITYKEELLYENNQQEERDEALHTSLTSELFDLQEAHEQLLKNIERDYPAYYQLKYDLKSVSIRDLQQEVISKDQTLVEYFLSDQNIYVFLINKEDIILKRLPKPADLSAMVQAFRKSIHEYNPLKNNETSIKQYADLGHSLYQQLIAPIQADLRPQVTFITNGLLEYLPFDALVIEAPQDLSQFQNYTYLVSNHSISYAYSATWLHTVLKKPRTSFRHTYLGVAPSFALKKGSKRSSRSNIFDPLKHNQSEVETIKEIMDGEVLLGIGATEEAFKERAKLYQILHLATHGESNTAQGNYSFLAFAAPKDTTQRQVLYVKDLQNINLPTELVVLSACETGIGELQRGEGVVSVGKGFSYAGARSVLSTLWKINDHSAAKLMPLFFENIKAGQTKDIALSNAKNTFIKTQRHTHPYYWSGYLVYGDTSKIRLSYFPSVFLGGVFGTLGFGLLASFLFLKFRKKL